MKLHNIFIIIITMNYFVWKLGTDQLSMGPESYAKCAFIHYYILFVTLSTNPSFAASIWVDFCAGFWTLPRTGIITHVRFLSLPFTLFLSLFLSVLILSLWLLNCTVILLSLLLNFPSILSSFLALLWLVY